MPKYLALTTKNVFKYALLQQNPLRNLENFQQQSRSPHSSDSIPKTVFQTPTTLEVNEGGNTITRQGRGFQYHISFGKGGTLPHSLQKKNRWKSVGNLLSRSQQSSTPHTMLPFLKQLVMTEKGKKGGISYRDFSTWYRSHRWENVGDDFFYVSVFKGLFMRDFISPCIYARKNPVIDVKFDFSIRK